MNTKKIVNEIMKSSVRLVSKKTFENKIDFNEQIKKFIGSLQSNLVKTKLIGSGFKEDQNTNQPYQHWLVKFEVFFSLNDPYIDSKVYASGTVYIFPSKKFYSDVNKLCVSMFGAYPEWNSTKTTATITGEARDY
jgi:hypothetical protein